MIAAVVGGVIVLGAAGASALLLKRRHATQNVSVQVTPDGGVVIQPVAPPPVAAAEPQPTPPAAPVETVLTNDNIIEMVDGKVANSVIIGQIRSAKTNFNLAPAELIRLTKAHVPAPVLEAMRDPKAAPVDRSATNKAASTTSKSQPAAPVAQPVQTTPTAPVQVPLPAVATPAPVPVPVTRTLDKVVLVTVADGSPIPLKLAADVPVELEEGQVIRFTVSQDFKEGDTVVIAKGAAATGAVVDVAGKKKFLGMGGSKVTFRLTQVDAVDGHKLNLRATPAKNANGPGQRPLEPAGKKPSKDLIAAAGMDYIGYIDGEQTASIKK